MVDFSHVSGSESADKAEIEVPVSSSVAVRLFATGGFRPVLVSVHPGLTCAETSSKHISSLSSEDVMQLLDKGPKDVPEGVVVSQAMPFHCEVFLCF